MPTGRTRRFLVVVMSTLLAWTQSFHAYDFAGSDAAEVPPPSPLAIDVQSALLPRDDAISERPRVGWISLLAVHGLSVAADLATTRRAFEHGAVEANPLYSWAGPNGALGLRAATGFALSLSLNRTQKTSPRLARGILWSTIVLNFAVAAHNEQLTR